MEILGNTQGISEDCLLGGCNKSWEEMQKAEVICAKLKMYAEHPTNRIKVLLSLMLDLF